MQPGESVVIEGQDGRHITRTLRLGVGDIITLIDSLGKEYIARILHGDTYKVTADVLSENNETSKEPKVSITIIQSLPKGDKMDIVIHGFRWFCVSGAIEEISVKVHKGIYVTFRKAMI